MTVSRTPVSPVPPDVGIELQRVVERWRQLPIDHALSYAGRVRALVQSLSDKVAEATGVPASVVPDRGPATLMDQLTVLVYDASAVDSRAAYPSAATVTSIGTSTPTSTLAEDLASLRRELH